MPNPYKKGTAKYEAHEKKLMAAKKKKRKGGGLYGGASQRKQLNKLMEE